MKFPSRRKYRVAVFIYMIIICTPGVLGQWSEYRGLEIYNPYYNNPAMILSDGILQLDLVGYSLTAQKGFTVNAMSTLSGINSSFRLYFEDEERTELDSRAMLLGYAYQYTVNEEAELTGGIALNTYRNIWDEGLAQTNIVYQESRGMNMHAGVGVNYLNFSAGLSAISRLYGSVESTLDSGNDSIVSQGFQLVSEYLTIRYLEQLRFDFTLEPVFGLEFINRYPSQAAAFYYAGAKLEYRQLIGIGVTVGSLTSLITSFNILNRVKLFFVVYSHFQTEGSFFYSKAYDWNLMGQIRVDL